MTESILGGGCKILGSVYMRCHNTETAFIPHQLTCRSESSAIINMGFTGSPTLIQSNTKDSIGVDKPSHCTSKENVATSQHGELQQKLKLPKLVTFQDTPDIFQVEKYPIEKYEKHHLSADERHEMNTYKEAMEVHPESVSNTRYVQ